MRPIVELLMEYDRAAAGAAATAREKMADVDAAVLCTLTSFRYWCVSTAGMSYPASVFRAWQNVPEHIKTSAWGIPEPGFGCRPKAAHVPLSPSHVMLNTIVVGVGVMVGDAAQRSSTQY
jgi:hypothetical protein